MKVFSIFGVTALAVALLLLVIPQSLAAGPNGNQSVVFRETGLAPGTHWAVTLHGVTHSTTGSMVTFTVNTGNYSYSVMHRIGYHSTPAKGYVVVSSGANVAVAVTFYSNGDSSASISNFNGTSIPAGDYIWFNAVLSPKTTVPSSGLRLHITNQSITLTFNNGTRTVLNVPDSIVRFSPTAKLGSVTFGKAGDRWRVTVPVSYSGDTFMSGLAYQVPSGGIPGGVNNVTWSASFGYFSSAVKGSFDVNWQWGAAVYTNFTTNYNLLDVKPLHSTSLDAYHNGDQAGTPEAYTSNVIGGARGGGGSNWTGSYSGTASVNAPKD